jgi:hypothetical protein
MVWQSYKKWVLLSLSLAVLGICSCAGVAFEAIGADEAVATATMAEEAAPALAEGVPEAVGERGVLTELLSTDRIPPRGLFIEDGETPGLYVNGNHLYDIDMPTGRITDARGNLVAQVEGNQIYRVYPRGTHELVAEIETHVAEPTAVYTRDPTDLTRIRMLDTNRVVQVVEARNGWYELRYIDESGSEVLVWAFAPALLTHVNRKDQPQSQPVSFVTEPSKRTVLLSTLDSAKKLRSDIDAIVSEQ